MATVLTIPTYDGSGQAVHPDVIKVGSTYWMAMTPYPASENDYENPSILSSADGLTWAVPAGLTNPVVPAPGGVEHNSDAELVYDDGTFYLFYRRNDELPGMDESLWVVTSADGVTWGTPTQILVGTQRAAMLSPAVVKDGDTWRMWVVDAAASPNVLRQRTASSPTGPWSSPVACTLTIPSGKDIWHVDVTARGGGYVAALNYCDSGDSGDHAYLAFGTSVDGLTWSLVSGVTIDPSGSTPERVYRGALLFDGGLWRLWYSDRLTSPSDTWRILHEELDADTFGVLGVPARIGAEVGFTATGPQVIISEEVTLYADRMGVEAGFRSGLRLRSAGARQVMLTGAGIETPEMTTGGTPGQVLAFRENDVPTWVDGGSTPASTVEAETSWGIAPAVGTDAQYARGDHTHGTPAEPAGGGVGPLLISDDHSTPIVFADLLLTEEEDDLLYADVGG